ncbi:MAG: single-stranded DNA-binding protein [Cytophagales bacterium]|nr:single-stranded DNA-binding protein [Bernardetiaceae bacterium]MDW8209893.1 single-stranded DNA-binding protein [Cytophagales bacterium]
MVNKAILIGYIGRDPLVRHTNNGIPVATFSVATSESYKDENGERKELTEWHNIVLWRHNAEFAEKYLKKGMKVYIEGKITTREYEQDGIKKYITEIVGNNVQILSSPASIADRPDREIPLPQEPPYFKKSSDASTKLSEKSGSAEKSEDSSLDAATNYPSLSSETGEDELPF